MKWLFIMLILSSQVKGAVTLKEAFSSAKLNMETLKRAQSEIQQSIERKNQARANLLPTINGVGNETRIDRPRDPSMNSAFTLTRQYSVGFRLLQPLFRGGTVSALQMRKDEILLANFQKDASEINLYQLVIGAYYNLHMAHVDLLNLSELLKLSQERVKELRSRTQVGRSRRGELVQAETQLLTAQAQYGQGEMNLKQAAETFEFYTGVKAIDLAKLSMLPKNLPSILEFMEKLKKRPDILARLQQVKVADERVGISKGAHYPNVDLISNYYLDRTGILASSDWDVSVQVTVPLFQGGGATALIKESVEAKKIAQLNSEEAIRAAKRDLAILYQNYHQIQIQLDTMNSALKKAQEAYRLNLQDYNYGQVTNLEVLQSLNFYIEAKRSYDNLKNVAHMTYRNLEASVGVLP